MLLEIGGFSQEHVDGVRGSLKFYHYKCDGQNDCGWGCGYRTLQTICSWVINVKGIESKFQVPSITNVQDILVRIGDKPSSFSRSQQWIGTCEVAMVLSELFDVDCKLVHVASGANLVQQMDILAQHFKQFGSPVMMGGDADAASKCILAVRSNQEMLILDPHYAGDQLTSVDQLKNSPYLRWYNIFDDFVMSSFYNLCLPQLKVD